MIGALRAFFADPPAEDPDFVHFLRQEQVLGLTRNITPLNIGRAALACVVVALLIGNVPWFWVVLWVLAFIGLTLHAELQGRRLLSLAERSMVTAADLNSAVAGLRAFGLLWAALAGFLFFDLPIIDADLLLLVMTGVMVFSVMTLHPVLAAAFGYSVPIGVASIVSVFVSHQPRGITLALLLMVVFVITALVTRGNHRAFVAALQLRALNQKLLEEAQVASRSKSEFLANISHELRTPLNAVIGFAEVIQAQLSGPLQPAYRDYARDIEKSGRQLLEMINDIIDLSRLEAGRLALHEEMIDPAMALRAALAACRARAEEVGIDLMEGEVANLPDILADQHRLRQILLNLLSNSLKFTPRGGWVRVSATKVDEAWIELLVADNGIGIAAEDIPRVLRPFGQVDSSLTRRSTGTGLGLALSRRLAEHQGGTLAIQSQPGQGTSVAIRLPIPSAAGPGKAPPPIESGIIDG